MSPLCSYNLARRWYNPWLYDDLLYHISDIPCEVAGLQDSSFSCVLASSKESKLLESKNQKLEIDKDEKNTKSVNHELTKGYPNLSDTISANDSSFISTDSKSIVLNQEVQNENLKESKH